MTTRFLEFVANSLVVTCFVMDQQRALFGRRTTEHFFHASFLVGKKNFPSRDWLQTSHTPVFTCVLGKSSPMFSARNRIPL